MFNVEIFWSVDTGVQKNIFCFLSDFTWNFSNSYSFTHMQEFNPLYPHLVLYDRKHFWYLDWFEQPFFLFFFFFSSKVLFAKLFDVIMFLQNIFQKCRAAVRKCSSEAIAQWGSVKKVFLVISQNSQENTRARAPASACNFIKKEALAQVFFLWILWKFLRTPFLTERLWWLLLVLQNRCS